MGLRDRFYTPRTAQAILSWRLAAAIAVAVGLTFFGLPWPIAVAVAIAGYVALVASAMPAARRHAKIDPFTVGEPWRRFVQSAQRAAARVHETVDASDPGPLRERMETIADKLDHGLREVFRIARRGDAIDDAVERLDPTALRSTLATLEQRRLASPDEHLDAAIVSVQSQLATTERLKAQSERTANRLRLTQTRLDELVARAAEVSVGAGDTDIYEHDVEDLVVELEGLRLAIQETSPETDRP